jgi:hypothetical protein
VQWQYSGSTVQNIPRGESLVVLTTLSQLSAADKEGGKGSEKAWTAHSRQPTDIWCFIQHERNRLQQAYLSCECRHGSIRGPCLASKAAEVRVHLSTRQLP